MDRGGDVVDLLLEQSQGVRVGEHDPGYVVVEALSQCGDVDTASVVRRDRDGLVAAEGDRRRVRAVRRVGDEDLGPLLLLRRVVRADHEHAGQLALRPRCRLEGDRVHPRHFRQHPAEVVHESKRALARRLGRERMQPGKAR